MKQFLLFTSIYLLFSCSSIHKNYGFKLTKKSSYKPLVQNTKTGGTETLILERIDETSVDFTDLDVALESDSVVSKHQRENSFLSDEQMKAKLIFSNDVQTQVEDSLTAAEIQQAALETQKVARKSKRLGITAFSLLAINFPLFAVNLFLFFIPGFFAFFILTFIASIVLSSIGIHLVKKANKAKYTTEKAIKDAKIGKSFSLATLITAGVIYLFFLTILVMLLVIFG